MHADAGADVDAERSSWFAELGDAVAELSEGDRTAIVEHVRALARMSATLRAAVLTLTASAPAANSGS